MAPADKDILYPQPRYAWYVVLILFLAYVMSFLDRQILTLLIEPIKQDLELTDITISLLHGFTFAIFYVIFGFPLGRMADSKNRRNLIIGGITLWSLMTAMCGFAKNAWMLAAARIGVAVGEASLSPSAYSLISDYFPRDKRGRATSFYSLGIFAGAGMAYIFGGLITEFAGQVVADSTGLLSNFKPWQLTFIMAGLPGLVVVVLMTTIREPARKELLDKGQRSVPMKQVMVYLLSHWKLYSTLLVGNAFIAMANYSLFAWLPAYFIRVYDYTPRSIGVTFGTIILIMGTTGLILGGVLSDLRYRLGHIGSHYDITVIATSLALVPVVIMYPDFGEQTQLVCVSVLLFFASFSTGLVPASMQLVTPNEFRGQVTAIYLFLTSVIGLGLGPTTVAIFTDKYYGDINAVGESLAITLGLSLAIAVVLMYSGRKFYVRRQMQLIEQLNK